MQPILPGRYATSRTSTRLHPSAPNVPVRNPPAGTGMPQAPSPGKVEAAISLHCVAATLYITRHRADGTVQATSRTTRVTKSPFQGQPLPHASWRERESNCGCRAPGVQEAARARRVNFARGRRDAAGVPPESPTATATREVGAHNTARTRAGRTRRGGEFPGPGAGGATIQKANSAARHSAPTTRDKWDVARCAPSHRSGGTTAPRSHHAMPTMAPRHKAVGLLQRLAAATQARAVHAKVLGVPRPFVGSRCGPLGGTRTAPTPAFRQLADPAIRPEEADRPAILTLNQMPNVRP